MAVKPIPDGYHSVTPYLVVPGVAKLLDFLKQAFEAKEVHRPMIRPDGTIMHAEVRIGDSVVMLGEPMVEVTPMPGSLNVYVSDTDAVYKRAPPRSRSQRTSFTGTATLACRIRSATGGGLPHTRRTSLPRNSRSVPQPCSSSEMMAGWYSTRADRTPRARPLSGRAAQLQLGIASRLPQLAC